MTPFLNLPHVNTGQATPSTATNCAWLRNGQQALDAMLAAIAGARHSVRLETFIFRADAIGDAFMEALVAAQLRGAQVHVLCDAFGSFSLKSGYWGRLMAAGGDFRWFNPLHLHRIIYRNHRKLLVVDDQVAFIGGFNIAAEYCGDGVTRGWRDLGLQIKGAPTAALAESFDDLFARADLRHRRFQRVRRTQSDAVLAGHDWTLLMTGPGRGHHALKQFLQHDFAHAKSIRIMSAYFLPSLRLLRGLRRAARRGARVQLILAGQSDVRLMRMATRGLYPPLLRAGVEIYEYRPQILHAKMIVVDDVVYAGSANLDARSLGINYELVARLPDPRLAAEARDMFEADLIHCRRIDHEEHRRLRTLWQRTFERWAYFILARIDPYLARRQRRNLLRL